MDGAAAVVLMLSAMAVLLFGVESQQRVCYSGPPPEPDPDNPEHWMKQVMREIRKRCPGRRQPTPAVTEKPCTTADSTDPEWRLVFKGVAGTGVELYDMWTTMDWNSSYEASCHRRNNSLYQAWRNGQLNVRRVKLSLYEGAIVRAELIFNGAGSDIRSWFTQTRLISSPWDDLKSAPFTGRIGQIFSIDGDVVRGRRFYINNYYGSCEVDKGWLAVNGFRTTCPWQTPTAAHPYPNILYSTTNQKVTWNDVRSNALLKKLVCENYPFSIACDVGTIDVEWALYGREDGTIDCQINAAVPCGDPTTSLTTVQAACQGKPQCAFIPSNTFFGGDPCPILGKYLVVHYLCSSANVH
ncbi:uncharacterized protein LOC119736587 [Patiria miniata]|uniref:SUEL-type lectin domain-containing protein n=1 Tax=Patiria miniata TaxID=46514 RepID=A0A914ARX9_PATMI|nr:uncharacterized protein LOC119736587 [Patiria miniata]